MEIGVWDENKSRTERLISDFNLLSIPALLIKYSIFADCPGQMEIQNIDVFFLSFDKNQDSLKKAQDIASFIKLNNRRCLLILISDDINHLGTFFRPSISPCGVICRPFTVKYLADIFEEVISEIQKLNDESSNLKSNENSNEGSSFDIKAGVNYYSFLYKDILFFEARSKKVALKTFGQEISFYSSIETINEKLPHYFIRCHRSFMINFNYMESIHFADMLICLKDGSKIPLSRSYKDNIKKFMNEKN